MKNDEHTDYNKPVAYDSQGRPLYAHPPQQSVGQDGEVFRPQVVQMTRSLDPVPVEVSAAALAKHQESLAKFPAMNLSEGEYIINEVRRHPIGLIMPIGLTTLASLGILGVLAFYPMLVQNSRGDLPPFESIIMPLVLLLVLIWLFGYIAVYVYMNNKFFLTNESVIQEIQTTLLSHHEQTVSLSNIEDASYKQSGIFEMLFNYGSIRLSTEGDETTYRFYFVSDPKKQIAILNNAVEAFKNGRPVIND